eukprot:3803864-Prymnesium_polylepis.1
MDRTVHGGYAGAVDAAVDARLPPSATRTEYTTTTRRDATRGMTHDPRGAGCGETRTQHTPSSNVYTIDDAAAPVRPHVRRASGRKIAHTRVVSGSEWPKKNASPFRF